MNIFKRILISNMYVALLLFQCLPHIDRVLVTVAREQTHRADQDVTGEGRLSQ